MGDEQKDSKDESEVTNLGEEARLESELDQTRMDIEVDLPSGVDQTSTSIRIEAPPDEPRVRQKKWQYYLHKIEPLFEKIKPVLIKIKKNLSQKIISKNKAASFDFKKITKSIFPLIFGILSLGLHGLFLQSVIDSFQTGLVWKWFLLLAFVISLFLSFLAFRLKWVYGWMVGIPVLFILILLNINLHFFDQSTETFFTLLGYPISGVLNLIVISFILLELLFVLFVYPWRFSLKIILIILMGYGLYGLILNRLSSVPLEASWAGVGAMDMLPFYLQPAFVTFEAIIPFLFFLSFFAFFYYFNKVSFISQWSFINTILLFAFGFYGWSVLQLNGVPNLISFVFPREIAIASAVYEGAYGQLVLKTTHFNRHQAKDEYARYLMDIKPIQKKSNKKSDQEAKIEFGVQVKDFQGKPVFFLDKENFRLFSGDRAVNQWSWKAQSTKYILTVSPQELQSAGKLEKSLTEDQQDITLAEQKIAPLNNTALLTPLEGDYFNDQLPVSLYVTQADLNSNPTFRFYLDEVLIAEKNEPPYHVELTTQAITSGTHQLKVTFQSAEVGGLENVLSQKQVVKAVVPEIRIKQPGIGSIVTAQTAIEVEAANSSPFKKIELFAGGQKIHEWSHPPYHYKWNTHELKPADYLITVKGIAQDNGQNSDWISVTVKEGMLSANIKQTDKADAGVNYQKVLFVLDASASMNDVWDGKTKWNWLRYFLRESRLREALSASKVGILAGGQKKSILSNECGELNWIYPIGEYQSMAMDKPMGTTIPRGVFSLSGALLEALKQKPDKIIAITDGGDPCIQKNSSLLTKQMTAQKTMLEILFLGKETSPDLIKLKTYFKGEQITVTSLTEGEKLVENIIAQVTPFYVLELNQRPLIKASFGEAIQKLKPGIYKLALPFDPIFEPRGILIRPGIKTNLVITKQDGQYELQETWVPQM